MSQALDYAQQNREQFLEQLKTLVSIPSVSSDPAYNDAMRTAAEWLAEDMRRIGLHNVEIAPTGGHPVLYGEWLGAGPDVPTVLLYAHYDVQPAQMSDGWHTDPFTPTERDGRLYGRGAADDKSHTLVILKAAECLLKGEGGSPVNLKFLIEGEEECGSPNLPPFVVANRDRLRADVCIIADGGLRTPDQPLIIYAMRGITTMEVTVEGPHTDLHSGMYGGSVHNPAQVIAEIVAQLHDSEGHITVPGFYDEVLPLSDQERAAIAESASPRARWDELVGAPDAWGEPEYTLAERLSARPTLEINGISGGYTGDGFKTVIPARAKAKISCRLVPDQDPDVIFERVRDYLHQIAPPTVRLTVEKLGGGDPSMVPLDSPVIAAMVRAYKHHWEQPVQYMRTGGSIPIVADFQRELGLTGVLIGFSTADANIHGPNENYHIDLYHKGIDTTILLLKEIAAG